MADEVVVEQTYLVPSHLRTRQSIGPFPARLLLPLMYATVFVGLPLGVSAWFATDGLLPPAVSAALIPALVLSPLMAWWLNPPAEHGVLAALGFLLRTFRKPAPPKPALVAVYRMPTLNLETADVAMRRQARAQWGGILNALTHPIKIIVRGRPITTLPVVEALHAHPNVMAQALGEWLEVHLAQAGLVDHERLLVIPAADDAELTFRVETMERALRQARLPAERVRPEDLPLLQTLTWDPHAAAAAPAAIQEGSTEALVDGWWTRAYALGRLPAAIVTNWASSLLAGDTPVDVVIDVVPQDVDTVNWLLDIRINQLLTSTLSVARKVALEQLESLRESFERRRVVPFEVAVTVIVRDASRKLVRDRAERIEQRVRSTGARLNILRWEQAAGLLQSDPTRTRPLRGRTHLIETGTLARTYPWSDGSLQLAEGVPWGEAGSRPCLFTPYNPRARGPHMALYGTTNAGKGMAAHLLWSRMHWIQGVRIFGIDQDEQHEHCGRFLEYLGGRKLTPRDAKDAADIELHADDSAVILDLSGVDEDEAGPIFAAWAKVVKEHMLAHPGRSIFFVDEAVTISEDPAAARALRDSFQRARHWGQSSHVMTQRVSDWFNTRVGRAIQGNCDAWWCGAQQPREIDEVARALRLTDEESELVRAAGIGTGLLVAGQQRVWLDLFDKLSPSEYRAFNSDPVIVPMKRKEDAA